MYDKNKVPGKYFVLQRD